MSIQRHITNHRLSEAVQANGFIFLAGQVPTITVQDAEAQTADILRQVDELLAHFGSDKTKLVEATLFITDLANFDAMNRAWDAWIPEGHAPARACVQAQLANPEWLVEIKLSAVA
ncbi:MULTISPECIES: RidA family protein [Vitreoscilla]|uniref:RidA family protein n=1 Tax=Vitreoscilla stercoraria TaxID=61 RepID=A0ABY4E8J3_VITST|nr:MULTISPECIES: RidA family protein [Vitreoscilla]AUZ04649.1 endoribonuclease L-PSP [Vitreoscilla sp. C1]UOO91656.1 RidA family protein [Vitreoscilla stercoraria]